MLAGSEITIQQMAPLIGLAHGPTLIVVRSEGDFAADPPLIPA